MRAVLDVNGVISGVLSRQGAPAQVLLAWEDGRLELILSPLLVAELERTLAYPNLRARISAADASGVIRWLVAGATSADDPRDASAVRSEDPGDDYLIALAARERAALVSGDTHLLAMRGRLPVYSPREFLELIGPSSR